MKLKQLFLAVFLMAVLSGYSQMLDLSQYMDQSKLVLSQVLYNQDESVYGYIFLYKLDKTDKNNMKYEYFIIDKNLNPVARNTFSQPIYDSRTVQDFMGCRKMGNTVFLQIGFAGMKAIASSYDNLYTYLITAYRSIDLTNNTISDQFYFENGTFKNIAVTEDDLRGKFKKVENYYNVYPVDNTQFKGYLIKEEYKESSDDYKIKALKAFDLDHKEVWSYDINKVPSKSSYYRINSVYWPDETIILTLYQYKNNDVTGRSLVGLNMNTGQKLFEYQIDNKSSEYYYNFDIKKYGDSIYLNGVYNPNDGNRDNWDGSLGWFRIVIDKSGKELSKKLQGWTSAKKHMSIKENGKVDGGYRLKYKDFFQFKNGTSAYLAEKFKEQAMASVLAQQDLSTSSDLVLVYFDENFEVVSVQNIDKGTTIASHHDYLFAQYINDNSGVVFFFHDDKQSKEDKKYYWFLGINKLLNGNYSYDEFKLGSRKTDYFLSPGIAKEGYILLREYNEKEKYNQIRLEKLNL